NRALRRQRIHEGGVLGPAELLAPATGVIPAWTRDVPDQKVVGHRLSSPLVRDTGPTPERSSPPRLACALRAAARFAPAAARASSRRVYAPCAGGSCRL